MCLIHFVINISQNSTRMSLADVWKCQDSVLGRVVNIAVLQLLQ